MSKQSAIANAFLMGAPIAIGAGVALLAPTAVLAPLTFAVFTITLYFAGLALFLLAKISLLRRGILISYGSAHMSPWNRRAYRAGYALMALGLFATFVSVLVAGATSAA